MRLTYSDDLLLSYEAADQQTADLQMAGLLKWMDESGLKFSTPEVVVWGSTPDSRPKTIGGISTSPSLCVLGMRLTEDLSAVALVAGAFNAADAAISDWRRKNGGCFGLGAAIAWGKEVLLGQVLYAGSVAARLLEDDNKEEGRWGEGWEDAVDARYSI